MANLEETVYTNAVRIVGTVKYVTKRTDIVPPVFLGLKDLNVMKVKIANVIFYLISFI